MGFGDCVEIATNSKGQIITRYIGFLFLYFSKKENPGMVLIRIFLLDHKICPLIIQEKFKGTFGDDDKGVNFN